MVSGRVRFLIISIVCLSLLLLGRLSAEIFGKDGPSDPTILSTMVLAQNSQDTVLKPLESHGAKIVKYSQVKDLVDQGKRKGGGVACVGTKQCLILIENFGSQCKSFRCGNDFGTPVCWCDT